ncbi:site-specific integrase [Novosphingobium sp. BL-52-GroH]|uniref:site-specific integrase n=1 Tax=Novosphingobium sp. BL-52-GroH TaxID=3349877 RepID=UPI0038515AB8
MGQAVDLSLLAPFEGEARKPLLPIPIRSETGAVGAVANAQYLTLGEIYERFMDDPTRGWSARTRLAYETARRLALSIIGADTYVDRLSRATCRDFMETLRFIPKNASKRYPQLSPREVAVRARAEGWPDLISPANVNLYLNKVCVVLNWAVQEEFLGKNHMRGLRLADPVAKHEKRHPFSDEQLCRIFTAPLYTGCKDDGSGYAISGGARPRGTRFWIPLIGLYSGLRLNEICQLDIADVRTVDDVCCFAITEKSLVGSTDKSLKTRSSERLVPVHPKLIDVGFSAFVVERACRGQVKLFEDICPGRNGFRSTAFSKWFSLFLTHAGASRERTSFHSFRHGFRDALRDARVGREISMALGGWGSGRSGADVSDNYGRGYRVDVLLQEISKVRFPVVDVAIETSRKP